MVNRETRGMWTQGRDDAHSFDRSNINARYVNARPSSLKASLSLSLFSFSNIDPTLRIGRKSVRSSVPFEFWHWSRKRYTPPYNTFGPPP